MGDSIKLSKEKRHRSSSSIAAGLLEGSRSERKLNIKDHKSGSVRDSNAYSGTASIPEVEDQFMVAEARCDQLQEKINLMKTLKRKRKSKKRSLTMVNETTADMPLISVRTHPKKKSLQLTGRPKNSRVYLESGAMEHDAPKPTRQAPENRQRYSNAGSRTPKSLSGRRSVRGDGGDTGLPSLQAHRGCPDLLKADRRTRNADDYSDAEFYGSGVDGEFYINAPSAPSEERHDRRYRYPHDVQQKDSSQSAGTKWSNESAESKPLRTVRNATLSPQSRRSVPRRPQSYLNMMKQPPQPQTQPEERDVVELFSKRQSADAHRRLRSTPGGSPDGDIWNVNQASDNETHFTAPSDNAPPMQPSFHDLPMPRRLKYRRDSMRRYEMPTLASQMKQSGHRFYGPNGGHQIPFVATKNTGPSHNIGVNIQQVLNGVKIQQPLTGIPMTIAHHMGLRHMPYNTRSENLTAHEREPTLDNREINMIKVGRRLVRLPSYKYMSYGRLLSMFRQGEGIVPRFLRSMNRPNCYYSSMYNLATNRTASTSKCGYSAETKQALAEYAALYREYELLEQELKERNVEPERVARRDELARELASREGHIRKVVQDYKSVATSEDIRASHSTTGSADRRRHSIFKLSLGEPQN